MPIRYINISIILSINLLINSFDIIIGRLILQLDIPRYMGRNKGDRTKLTSAKIMTDSLRTTVPSSIVRQMRLNAGDQLEWQIESLDPGIVKVSIVRSEKKHGE